MEPKNIQNNQDNGTQDAIIIIDMNNFPKEIREKLPKDLQDKLMELLQEGKMSNIHPSQTCKEKQSERNKDNRMFSMQTGTVIGNIYDKNFNIDDIDNKR